MGFTDTSDSSSGFLSGSDFENLPLHPESLKSAELNESLGLSHSQHSETETENEINDAIYYVDSLNEGTEALAKQQIPRELHATLSKMAQESNPPPPYFESRS